MNNTDFEKTIRALSEQVKYPVTLLANASALIYEELDGLNWAGFYLACEEGLYLGPFQGRVACTYIPKNHGVCGACARELQTLNVPNVHEFPGHIACDTRSQSELVVPLFIKGTLYGVLDLDSPVLSYFDQAAEEKAQMMASVLENYLEVLLDERPEKKEG